MVAVLALVVGCGGSGPTTAPTVPSPSPSVSPTPNPTPSLSLSPTRPSPQSPGSPIVASCDTSLQSILDQAPDGAIVDLGTCVYTDPVDIHNPVTILHGTIRVPAGVTAVTVDADDVTIDSVKFEGGGFTVKVAGRDRTKILRSTFTDMTETSISLDGPGVDDALIEGNTIVQSIPNGDGYSPISAQGFGRGVNTNLVVRGNTIDQGGSGVAHFGIEVWDNTGLVIEGNNLRGLDTLISIPRSDGAIVRNNTFDFTSGSYWGVEVSDSDGVQIVDNVVLGRGASDGPDGRAFVQLQKGSGTVENVTIQRNKVSNLWALVNAAGSGHTITNNCLTDVSKIFAFKFDGPVTIADNETCP